MAWYDVFGDDDGYDDDMYFDEADYASSGGAGNVWGSGENDYFYDTSYDDSNDMYFDEADFLASGGAGNYYGEDSYNIGKDDGYFWDDWGTGSNFLGKGNKYTGVGSALGGLFGGKDGSLSGSDLMGYLGTGVDAYMGKRENDRYNEMQKPMTDLYKAQAADVQNRRDNRDANLAAEYSEWEGLMQPQWDRRDQRADNLRQAQGQTQSSTSAWNRAANEQARDATKLASRRAMSKDYDTRTGMLGGQLSALNPLGQKGYLERQENPWLSMLTQG